MKKYHIDRTDTAEEQLRNIILYYAQLSPAGALRLLDAFEDAIHGLEDFPEMGSYPRYASLRQRHFRVLVVEKYLVFYKIYPEKKRIIIHAIVDGRREYRNLI